MAERSNFNDVVFDQEGNALDNIRVTVSASGSTTPVDIYSGKTGGSMANEFLTDETGEINFWAEPGSYDITLHDETLPPRVSDKVFGWEAVSGDLQGIDRPQLPSMENYISESMIKNGVIGTDKIKLESRNVVGSAVSGSADHVWAQITNIPPGIYHAVGWIGTDDISSLGGSGSLRFDSVGGNASFKTSSASFSGVSVSSVITVTATTTIRLRGQANAGFGRDGGFTLYGIRK